MNVWASTYQLYISYIIFVVLHTLSIGLYKLSENSIGSLDVQQFGLKRYSCVVRKMHPMGRSFMDRPPNRSLAFC